MAVTTNSMAIGLLSSTFGHVLLNQIEQILLYIVGFGLSDMLIEQFHFNRTQKMMYFLTLAIFALCILYYTMDN